MVHLPWLIMVQVFCFCMTIFTVLLLYDYVLYLLILTLLEAAQNCLRWMAYNQSINKCTQIAKSQLES